MALKANVIQGRARQGNRLLSEKIEVRDPQDNRLIDTVPAGTVKDMKKAVSVAVQAAQQAADMPVHERMSILNRTARIVEKRSEQFACMIAAESSKTIREARSEVRRTQETLRISAEEARRLNGQTIPFDQMPGSENRLGYYERFPLGVIGAITPFNDPLNLVAHKVGPAIAAGNAIVVKPASLTPLSCLLLQEAFIEAGLPERLLQVVTGYGGQVTEPLITHRDVRLISFTGGAQVGEDIIRKAGLKKISMELGSNCPVIVLSDADLGAAADATVSGAFSAAGQNCIGVQRVYVHIDVYEPFVQQFTDRARKMITGDKRSEWTDMGPMIHEREAQRVEKWVREAVSEGAGLLCGGERDGAFYLPTVLTDVPDHCTLAREEVFGPVVCLHRVAGLEEAISAANATEYGLHAGIFTQDMDMAFSAIKRLQVGGVMINDSSDYRIDAMPFGGLQRSGIGREGVRFAMEDMTEQRVVCFNLKESLLTE